MTMTTTEADIDTMPSVAQAPPRPAKTPSAAHAPVPAVSKPYVAAWVCIGGLSAAYLAAAVIDPEAMADLTRGAGTPVLEASASTGIVRQTVANVQSLQKAVTALSGDVANLKSSAHLQAVRQAETGERVAQIEGRLSGIAAAAPVVPGLPRTARSVDVTPLEPVSIAAATAVPVPPAAKLADQMANAAPVEAAAKLADAKANEPKNQGRLSVPGMIVQTSPPVAPAAVKAQPVPTETRASRQALQDQAQVQLLPSSIETGGINRVSAAPVPATPAPSAAVAPPVAAAPIVAAAKVAAPAKPRSPSAVQIAAGPSIDALRLSWMLLSDRHSNVLKPLEPRFVSDEPGIFRLVAGPFASPAEAQRACADLKARGATCQTAEFNGEAL